MIFQFGSALLDACVLSVLSQGNTYGYELTQQVRKVLDISESTLYPVLRRLQKDSLLTTYDQPFQGRNRRYYQITTQGTHRLTQCRTEWVDYKQRVDSILLNPTPYINPEKEGAPRE